MSKKLVIVESPAKTHTIGDFLGDNYLVVSSKGHIRDLATTGKYGLGVDVEGNFEPNYIAISGKKKDITTLKKQVKEADHVYLATDPDREGEAISWHLYDALDINDNEYDRVVFNEITKTAVLEAFNNTRKIDMGLVKSQETRRILDRIIGFRLSKLMQSKTGGKSAGRVQSVALKLIVDREKEISAFIPEEYWNVTAHFDKFDANLEEYNHEKLEIHNENEVNDILNKLSDTYKIESIEEKEKERKGVYPFTTSTLQQACINKFNYNSSKTMRIAQKLYEGVDLGSESVGLITYMRTDSVRLSDQFVGEGMHYIETQYGKEYIGYVKKAKKTENVQDAHEAIRPTSINRTPASVKEYLSNEEYKVYSIIYARALASLMKDAKVLATTVYLNNNNYGFKANGNVLIFDGFLKVYGDYASTKDEILPDMKQYNGVCISDNVETVQKFTNPPLRYTEASLIAEMEKLGIGRPSTYAKTIDTLKQRTYVKIEDKKFIPTEVGIETTDKLQEFFSDLINVEYTAKMEEDLDDIADESVDNVKLLRDFYNEFEPAVKNAFDKMEKKAPEETGEVCPNCSSPLVKRRGRFGEFVACSNYPECKYIKKEEKVVTNICKCPKCDGDIVEKKSRRGKVFYGCDHYPKCDVAFWDKPTGELCPVCNSLLLEKKDTIYCSNCTYKKEDNE